MTMSASSTSCSFSTLCASPRPRSGTPSISHLRGCRTTLTALLRLLFQSCNSRSIASRALATSPDEAIEHLMSGLSRGISCPPLQTFAGRASPGKDDSTKRSPGAPRCIETAVWTGAGSRVFVSDSSTHLVLIEIVRPASRRSPCPRSSAVVALRLGRGSRPRAARRRPLPGASWQRCRTHYAANLMSSTPKSSWRRCGRCARSTTALGLRPARRATRARPVRPDPRRPGRETARRGRAPRYRPRRHARVHRVPARRSGARSGRTIPGVILSPRMIKPLSCCFAS